MKELERRALLGDRQAQEECSRLEWIHAGGQTVCKCAIYGVAPGAATDWSADWEACGMRNRSYAEVNIQTLEPDGPEKFPAP